MSNKFSVSMKINFFEVYVNPDANLSYDLTVAIDKLNVIYEQKSKKFNAGFKTAIDTITLNDNVADRKLTIIYTVYFENKILKRHSFHHFLKDGIQKEFSLLILQNKGKGQTERNTVYDRMISKVPMKTLCDALKELAAFERQKGTSAFVNYIIESLRSAPNHFPVLHHKNSDGIEENPEKNSAPKSWKLSNGSQAILEPSEFRDRIGVYDFFIDTTIPQNKIIKEKRQNANNITYASSRGRFPMPQGTFKPSFFQKKNGWFDIEYIEVGYALNRKGYNAGLVYTAWTTGKYILSSSAGTSYSHPPNHDALFMGSYIADGYTNLTEFTKIFCNYKK